MFSFGNHKLPKTTSTFNMTTARDCPSKKLGTCNAVVNGHCYCYAKIPELRFPKVVKYRKKQQKWWRECTPETFVKRLLDCKQDFNKLRFSEAGDFPNQDSVNKAEEIAKLLWTDKDIVTYCHTSRSDLDYSGLVFLRVRGSGFIKPGLWGTTNIITKSSDLKKYKDKYICPGNCKYCHYCMDEQGLVLFLLH